MLVEELTGAGLPALPRLTAELGAPMTSAQLTMSLVLLAFGVGQVLAGHGSHLLPHLLDGRDEAADFMVRVPLLGLVPGLPLAELGIDADGVVARLGPVPFECGVIAGNRTVNPILSLVIPGPDDGKVAIARASAAGVRDFLVVPHSHPFIMRAPMVHRQIFHFLAHGRFAAGEPSGPPEP